MRAIGDTAAGARPGRGARSLEVRWIRPGPVPPALISHLGPFDDPIERRADRYLVDLGIPGLGVKIRGGIQLDLKASRGSPGRLRVAGGEGTLEVWEKWTLPLQHDAAPDPASAGWVTLHKTRYRRTFELTAAGLVERPVLEEIESGCTVDLTEVDRSGDVWWTLAFEATGSPGSLEPCLRACAGLLLDRPLPDGIGLPLETSMSYTHWLGRSPAPERSATHPGGQRR
ncbi:MAG: hypothetical protein ACXWX4_05000 [Actinomycetota bacterium]